jgi:recombination protein RecA
MPPKTKAKAAPPTTLSGLRDRMTKKYGAGRIVRRSEVEPYLVIPTGSYELDQALIVGGWVRGRINEIAGQEGSGKTTLCINAMREAQEAYPDLAAGFIDMEQTFDWDWAEANGLDTSDKRFVYAYPNNSEDVSDQVKEMMETGLFSIIIVDSIGGMESKVAFDKEAEQKVMGDNAQVITRMVKRLAFLAREHKCAVLLINQFRANIANPMGADITAGPKALKYATTVRVDVRQVFEDRIMATLPGIKEPQEIGVKIAARVVRNKVGPKGRTGSFFLISQPTEEHGPIGIDVATEALTIGIETGIVVVEGGGYHSFPWTTDKKERVHGKKAALEFLREHPERTADIRRLAVQAQAHLVEEDTVVSFENEQGEEVTIDTKTGEAISA